MWFSAVVHEYSQTLKGIHAAITHVQEWTMRHKGDPLYFHKIMKPWVELDKALIQMLIWNYENLPLLITSIEASYAQFFKSLHVIVRTHKIPSIGSLAQAIKKNQVLLEVDKYMEQLMRKATNNDLQLSAENMQKYISGPTTLRKMFRILQDELDKGSITICLEVKEPRIHF